MFCDEMPNCCAMGVITGLPFKEDIEAEMDCNEQNRTETINNLFDEIERLKKEYSATLITLNNEQLPIYQNRLLKTGWKLLAEHLSNSNHQHYTRVNLFIYNKHPEKNMARTGSLNPRKYK